MRLQVGVALVFFLGLRQANADINSLDRGAEGGGGGGSVMAIADPVCGRV
jgi:hypothetical protein